MYRFKSRADGDLLMMDPVGEQMLRLVGRDPAPKGIIECAALPAAIAALERAVAEAEAMTGKAGKAADNGDNGSDGDGDEGARGIGLKQRAWPLLEMMRRSLAERADIVWGV